MSFHRFLLAALILAGIIGCRYRDPSIDLLEGELRWMEDQLYVLEDELNSKCEELAICQSQACQPVPTPAAPSTQPKSAPSTTVPDELQMIPPPAYEIAPLDETPRGGTHVEEPTIDLPRTEPPPPPAVDYEGNEYEIIEPSVELPSDPQPGTAPEEELDMSEPEVEIPSPDAETSEPTVEIPEPANLLPEPTIDMEPEPAAPFRGDSPQLEGNENRKESDPIDLSIRLQSFDQPVSAQKSIDHVAPDVNVTHIVMQARLAEGYNFDDRRDDVDVLIRVEPRNAAGKYVALAGPISLVVLDGSKEGPDASVARWDFDARQARRLIRESDNGPGIHFELKWPEEAPDGDELYLFVRYLTVEGRKLESDTKLEADRERPRNGDWKVVRRRKSDPQRVSSSETFVVKGGGIKLRPIPEAAPTSEKQPEPTGNAPSFSVEEDTHTEMPVLRRASAARPEWKPFR